MNRGKTIARASLLLFAILILVGFRPLQSADDLHVQITQVDTSRFPQVTVYVSVTDSKGQPVNVNAKSLAVSEAGNPVEASQISGAGKVEALTTLLVIDISGSMAQNGKIDAAKQAAIEYVNQLRAGDKSGLVAFNTQVSYLQPITEDKTALMNAITSLKPANDTAMYDALIKAVDILGGVAGRKAIIVLTDGIDNQSKANADQVIKQIGPAGLSIATIGLGDSSQGRATQAGLDEPALKSLAERAGGTYAFINNADALKQLFQQTGRTLQSEYAITYTSPAKLRDGVNRSLGVSVAKQATVVSEYNPGGLVPEVEQGAAWQLFIAGLAVLLLLFFAPALIERGSQIIAARGAQPKKASRIKIKDQTVPRVRMH